VRNTFNDRQSAFRNSLGNPTLNLEELFSQTHIDLKRFPLSRVFDALADMDSAAQSAALARIHALNSELAAQLKQLLENDESTAPAPEPPLIPVNAIAALTPSELSASITLVELIGEGGMGEVWKARRRLQGVSSEIDEPPLEQLVAIKLLKSYTRNEHARARFRGEQAHLIKLVHPNIARLLDAGESSSGTPWIALELVEGLPITRWCDARRATIRERLQLFQQVCAAVQFAHEHFIIHRDIKPSNVLVDQHGQVKLLDFGIAKSSKSESLTGTQDRLFSIYAVSPEQLRNEPVSTATDCYALGALLYELLCGAPLLPESISTPSALEHFVVHTSPAAPSARASMAAAVLRQLKSQEELSRALRGDLDKIILHALRKRADERYRAVTAFEQDIDAALHQKPVIAVGQSTRYRAQKFLRRHWLAVSTCAAALLALFTLTGLLYLRGNELTRSRDSALQAQARAETAQENSRQVNLFLLGLFKQANPLTSADPTASMNKLIAQGMQEALRTESALHQNFEVQLGLLNAAISFGIDNEKVNELLDALWNKRNVLSIAQQQQLMDTALGASTNGIDQKMMETWGARAEHSLRQQANSALQLSYDSAKAAIAFSNGDFESAEKLTRRLPLEPQLVAIRSVSLAYLGENQRAQQLLVDTISNAGSEQRWLSDWYGALSQVQGLVGEGKRATVNAQKSLAFAQEQFGENGAQTLIARNVYALSAMSSGDFDAASQEFSKLLIQMKNQGIADDRFQIVHFNRLVALGKKGVLTDQDVAELKKIADASQTPDNVKIGCHLALLRYHIGTKDMQSANARLTLALGLEKFASPSQHAFLKVWKYLLDKRVKASKVEMLALAEPITRTDKQLLILLNKY
jgi:eukaryotic-like serine/threonine-protein kinase